MQTTVTLFSNVRDAPGCPVRLQAILFNQQGEVMASWQLQLHEQRPVYIDSASTGPWDIAKGQDGILALFSFMEQAASQDEKKLYRRLYPLVDWRRPDGRMASLHSDQIVRRGRDRLQRFTEIVVLENQHETNALILLNGEEPQAPHCLELQIQNCRGEVLTRTYAPAMAAFTIHRVELAALFPGISDFSRGEEIKVEGHFASKGLFSRPYVETSGPRWGLHHAGDFYSDWPDRHYIVHSFVGGEVNPMAVLHDGQYRTFVSLLHSHGAHEGDVFVDARLYDTRGQLVAERLRWKLARRHGVSRTDISELLPAPGQAFRGHIALAFAPEKDQAVPFHLQALLEYRATNSVARVMGWSDEWNSDVRVARRERSGQPRPSRAYFRVRDDALAFTQVAITNAGHPGYTETAKVRLVLFGAEGQQLEQTVVLAPYETLWQSIDDLFGHTTTLSGNNGLGVLLLESQTDLAAIAFTFHRDGGAVAAEHFMAIGEFVDGSYVLPSGA